MIQIGVIFVVAVVVIIYLMPSFCFLMSWWSCRIHFISLWEYCTTIVPHTTSMHAAGCTILYCTVLYSVLCTVFCCCCCWYHSFILIPNWLIDRSIARLLLVVCNILDTKQTALCFARLPFKKYGVIIYAVTNALQYRHLVSLFSCRVHNINIINIYCSADWLLARCLLQFVWSIPSILRVDETAKYISESRSTLTFKKSNNVLRYSVLSVVGARVKWGRIIVASDYCITGL